MNHARRVRLAWSIAATAMVPLVWTFHAPPANQLLSFVAQAIALLLFVACVAIASFLSVTTYWGAMETEEL